jgi:hypothetical protein
MSKPLTLETLGKLNDGAYGAAINRAFDAALRDCEDRPGLVKDRTITITVKVQPLDLGGKDLTRVKYSPAVNVTVPAQAAYPEILEVKVFKDDLGKVHAIDAMLPEQPDLFNEKDAN